jgi:hypothetical protein
VKQYNKDNNIPHAPRPQRAPRPAREPRAPPPARESACSGLQVMYPTP